MTQYLWKVRYEIGTCELFYRQNRYATLTGVQDVFQIYEIPAYELDDRLEKVY